ncbi:MAG: sensor histidine kinase [Anaerolineae bacterium]
MTDRLPRPRKIGLRILFGLLSLVLPLLVGYDIYFQWNTATLDVSVDEATGRVSHVAQQSFADWAGLWEGDVILSIEGVPFSAWHRRVPGNYMAQVQRGDRRLEMELYFVPLVKVNRWPLISGVVTALVFWGVGTVLLWRRFARSEVRLLFLLLQVLGVAALFLLAHPEGTRMPWMDRLGMMCFQLAAPLVLHHILTFPALTDYSRARRRVLGLAYGLTLAAIAGTWLLPGRWVQALLVSTALAFLAIGGLLIYIYVHLASPEERRGLRLILFGNLAAGLPTLVVYILPYLLHLPWRPATWTAGFFMILAPISYLLSVTRYRLFDIDRLLNRALVYGLLSLGILLLYLGPFLLLYRFVPGDVAAQILVVSILTLLIGLGFDWARTRAQRWVDRFFYGGWYDYPSVVETVSAALARTLERQQLHDVLTRRVPTLMQLQDAKLQFVEPGESIPPALPPAAAALRFLLEFQGDVRATWEIGARRDGDDFSSTDRRILQTLARQAEVALGNVLLVEALRRRLNEIREAQRQLLHSREEERSRLARDLHDGPVQLLVGLNLQVGLLLNQLDLSGVEDSGATVRQELRGLRSEVRQLLADLRRVCTDLRPPMLDTLGLGAALRALAEAWSNQHGIPLNVQLPTNRTLRDLPADVAVNLYRVTQEALNNVAHHADARHVLLRLRREGARLSLTVRDDGRGFSVPDHLRQLAVADHFGLIGIQERVELIGGELTLTSSPGQGTTVHVTAPTELPTS